ncbi:MAG: ZIP family metal transporter [Nanoarchaeota archaeon]
MLDVWLYTIISVIAVSAISLIGIFFLSLRVEKLEKLLIYMISFSAGALLGDAFIHLLPEAVKSSGFSLIISFSVLAGIGFSFAAEKIIHWRHCHLPTTKAHPHHLSTMNLVGEGVHNFIDGIIIATSYLISIPVGIATTIAVVFHEIPQEISDFGVLVYGGYSRMKAILANFLIALTAILGAVLTLLIGSSIENILIFLIPFAAGNFIYIAGSDLIPELHKETKLKVSLAQLALFVLGILVMFGLILLE